MESSFCAIAQTCSKKIKPKIKQALRSEELEETMRGEKRKKKKKDEENAHAQTYRKGGKPQIIQNRIHWLEAYNSSTSFWTEAKIFFLCNF